MDFGERLRQLREARGLSMRQLAERSDVDVGVISRVERGQYKPPKIGTIEKLARALELTADEEAGLLQRSGRLQPEPNDVDEPPATGKETEHELHARLAALEERVRRLEARSGEVD